MNENAHERQQDYDWHLWGHVGPDIHHWGLTDVAESACPIHSRWARGVAVASLVSQSAVGETALRQRNRGSADEYSTDTRSTSGRLGLPQHGTLLAAVLGAAARWRVFRHSGA